MRTRAKQGLALVMVIGAVTSGAASAGSAAFAAPAVAPTIAIVAPLPAPVIAPTVTFEVRLDGTTGEQDEQGYEWSTSGWHLVADGFEVRGTWQSVQVIQTRYLGRTAAFDVTPRYNGHHRFTVKNQYAATVVEFDAAVPGLPSLPPPPTNVRVETDRLALPVNGVTASFSYRFVSDEPFENAQRGRDEGEGGCCTYVGNTTNWQDSFIRWIDGTPETIKATFVFGSHSFGTDVGYTKTFSVPVSFAAAAVFATYPPEAVLACPNATKVQFTCAAAVVNAGVHEGLQVVPNQYTLIIENRSRTRPRGFGPWRETSRVPVNLNGGPVAVPVSWRACANPRASLQIRISVEGLPAVSTGGTWPRGGGC